MATSSVSSPSPSSKRRERMKEWFLRVSGGRLKDLFPVAMTKPVPKPINPAQLRELALSVIAADRFPQLATIDGQQPRVRPVSPVRSDGFTIYVANLRLYHKTVEIAANPRVELCYMDAGHNQVRLTGIAQIVTERPLLEQIWNDNALMRQFLGSLDNPQLIVYRIRPMQIRYMQEWSLEYSNVELLENEKSPTSPPASG